MPLLTMVHEIGGHAATCVATGGRLAELGAFYVNCDSESIGARRLVAISGMAIDAIVGGVAFVVWRRLLHGDLARLIGWYVWLSLCFSAAGYFLFSGVSGIGDLGPGEDGGIGPLPNPLVWRAAFAAFGLFAYIHLVKTGIKTLNSMIGQGAMTTPARRTIAHGFYLVLCVSAVAASIPNPVGLFVTLASAAAASFGGKAGLISIGYATRGRGEPQSFEVKRNVPIFAVGLLASLAFAAILGPTLHFG
ncbi:MAG: hypothetical protein NTX28_15745 [Novosphingobium sp.]|nr:hypothetical protein [Novosphingobium sp.]